MSVCRQIGAKLHEIQLNLATDQSFARSPEHLALRDSIRALNSELAELKRCRAKLLHSYAVVLHGDMVHDGILLRDVPVNCEVNTVIDCKLGSENVLSRTAGAHKAFWNLLMARFGAMFFDRKFRMEYIVQIR